MKVVMINAMWCPGCIVMHKVWKAVEEKYNNNIQFEKLDYDMDEEKVKEYNPGKILPITIILKDNIEIDRLIGEKTLEEVIFTIEKNK